MSSSGDTVIERVTVREIAGVFRSRDRLDRAVAALLLSGFDRADLDITTPDAARETLGFDVPAVELPDVPGIPRRPVVAGEDVVITAATGVGILMFAGAAIGAYAVVVAGGGFALALLAAVVGAAIAGGIGTWIAQRLRHRHAPELEPPDAGAASLILLVRVRSPEREAKAQEILLAHQAEAVRVHEVEVEKRLADLPLSSLRIDPWLGDERLGQP
jgi:outer membrane lipoprotein SlyB